MSESPIVIEIPLRRIKKEFNGYEINPTASQLVDFTSALESYTYNMNKADAAMAVWWTVSEMNRLLNEGHNFDMAINKVRWPAKVPVGREISIHEMRKQFNSRSKQDKDEELQKQIQVRFEELKSKYFEEYDELQREFLGTINPFKRRRIHKEIKELTLQNYVEKVVWPKLRTEFSQSTKEVDDQVKRYLTAIKNIRPPTQKELELYSLSSLSKWDRKKFRSWVNDILATIQDTDYDARPPWQITAEDILISYYPNRKDSDEIAYDKALSIFNEFDGNSEENLSNYASELRSRFLGKN